MKRFLTILGVFFVVIGVAGFIPILVTQNEHGQLLFGFIQVNYFQSFFHILSGAAALAAASTNKAYYMLRYLVVFGAVYLVLAIWGIPALANQHYDGVLFSLVHVNLATELVHIAIAASVIAIGMANMPAKKPSTPHSSHVA